MRTWRRQVRRTSVRGRFLLVTVLLAGVLGMHGLADLLPATAGTSVGHGATTPAEAAPGPDGDHAHGGRTTDPLVGLVADAAGTAGPADAPAWPLPTQDHAHDVLVGCVLALVGVVAVAVWAAGARDAPATWRARPGQHRAPAPPVGLLPPGPPLLLSLCVQRV